MNYATMTKAELIAECRKHGLPTGDTARNSKEHYAAMLEKAGFASSTSDSTSNSDSTSDSNTSINTSNSTSNSKSAAPDVTQVASLLAQLLGSGAVNESRVREIVDDALRGIVAPMRIEVSNTRTESTVELGLQHRQLPLLLDSLQAGCNVWLVGPAGSGKTTAAEACARALGLPFYFNGALDTEYKLSGFVDAQGRIVSTAFRKAYTEGGVYLFDEVDASLAPATLAFNAALSNGHCDFPGSEQPTPRHVDFYCIAAGNTVNGATAEFVGRNRPDGAFLDRFVQIQWDYDTALESALAGNPEWVAYVHLIRAKAKAKGIKTVIATPRASMNGARMLARGMKRDDVIALTMANRVTADQWKALTE